MASKSLSFLLFGEDVTASKAFEKVARSAAAADGTVKGAFSKGSILGVGALVAGLGLAAKGAADFQTQMTRLVTAAGESQGNLAMVSKGVMSISSATGTSLKATGDAMYYIESAGFHGAKGLQVLKAAAQGAKVEGADTKVVADALTTALTDLGKKAGPPAQVMSELVATVAHGKMTMDDLAGSLHSVLPNATAIGIAFPQVAAAIATMTAQGISADQATQNLNHAILSLANPTAVQTNAMAALGLNSSVVAKNLGKDGLTGTLEELSTAITTHMGPAGLTITNALNQSQIAAGKATEAYNALNPAMKKYADGVISGAMSTVTARQLGQGFDLAQKTQIQQWERLYKGAHGFSDLLKAKSPDALTYAAALAKITGGQTGLQVALHLTGGNMATFKDNVKDISKATSDAGGNVADFAVKEKTLNQKLDELKTSASNAGVALGTDLIPPLTSAAGFVLKHKQAFEDLAIAFVGIKGAIAGVKLAQEAWAASSAFGTLVAKFLAIGTAAGTMATEVEIADAKAGAAGGATGIAGGVGGAALKGGVAGAAARGIAAVTAGTSLSAVLLPLITSSDQSKLQQYQTEMDSLAKEYPNVRKLGVDAFGSLAEAMSAGRITVDEYKDALKAGSAQVAVDEVRTRALALAQENQRIKTMGLAQSQGQLIGTLRQTPAQVKTMAVLDNAQAEQRIANLRSDLSRLAHTPTITHVQIVGDNIYGVRTLLQGIYGQPIYQNIIATPGGGIVVQPGAAHPAAHASGGFLNPGWNLVGEQGPELINSSGQVMSASQTRGLRSGGNVYNFHIAALPGTEYQTGQKIIQYVQTYLGRAAQI